MSKDSQNRKKEAESNYIDLSFVQSLLSRQEGVTLEFKQSMYQVFCEDKEGEKRHKGELIKDILALANRNVAYVGDDSYLIIGADDKQDDNGKRELFDITDQFYEQKDLLQLVNASCDPPIEDLKCEKLEIDGKHIWVVKIPPTRYLHETTKELWCKAVQGADSDIRKKKNEVDSKYSIRTAFLRSGESIRVATMKERIAIEEAKEKYYKKNKGISPKNLGIIIGMLTGSPLSTNIAKLLGYDPRIIFFIGIVFFGIFGGVMGHYIHEFQSIYFDYSTYNLKHKIALIVISVLILVFIILIYTREVF